MLWLLLMLCICHTPLSAQGNAASANATANTRALAARRNIMRALDTTLLWWDVRQASIVDPCQVSYRNLCYADHNDHPNGRPEMIAFGNPLLPSTERMLALKRIPRALDFIFGPQPSLISPRLLRESRIVLGDLRRWSQDAPDNGWFAAMLVYLYVNAGQPDSARVAAARCRPLDGGWCLATAGWVRDSYGDFDGAAAFYDAALGKMGPGQRCAWRDIAPLLDERARASYLAVSCNERVAIEERHWWLSKPLLSQPANERKVAHFSRRFLDSLFQGSAGRFHHKSRRTTWSSDISNSLLRYGMPTHWVRTEGVLGWGHLNSPAYSLLPAPLSDPLLGDFTDFPASQWRISRPLDMAQERYAPLYGHISELTHLQIVTYPRGDSVDLVAAVDLNAEALVEVAPLRAHLVLARGPEQAPIVQTLRDASNVAKIRQRVARDPTLLGVEVYSERWQVVARTRMGLRYPRQPDGPAISELLLYYPDTAVGASPPYTTDGAVARMMARNEVQQAAPVGIYWELYNFAPNEEIAYSIRAHRVADVYGPVTRHPAGDRVAEPGVMALAQWTTRAGSGAAGTGHSIAIGLSALSPGTYNIAVNAMSARGTAAGANRLIKVVRELGSPTLEQIVRQYAPPTSEFRTYYPVIRRR